LPEQTQVSYVLKTACSRMEDN